MPERNATLDLLGGWFRKNEIKAIALDFDDTLVDTNTLFRVCMDRFVFSVVEKNPDLDWRKVKEKFVEFNNEAFSTYAVHKKKFSIVANELDSFFGTYPLFARHADMAGHIYRSAPNVLRGARETLETFSEVGMPMALVTHANGIWTDLKLDKTDLRKYFAHIEIADESRPKSSKSWLKAANSLNVLPREVLVIGDNLQGDIISALSIGVKHVIWIKSPWSLYRKGVVPEGIIQVKGINEVVGALIGKS